MLRAGVDIGSVNTKVVIFDTDRAAIVGRCVQPTGHRPKDAAQATLDSCLANVGLERAKLAEVVTTGYARHAAGFTGKAVTEIRAAARGISQWHPGCRTIVDLGGQDSKVIALDETGSVQDFVMNDRCAAGTGNFLAVLAVKLNVPLELFGKLSLESHRPVRISSLCVVMAESEILSLAAADIPVQDIIAGLHQALAVRIANMAAPLAVQPPVVFTGGVAFDDGMKRALETALAQKLTVAQEPLYAAALGAALS